MLVKKKRWQGRHAAQGGDPFVFGFRGGRSGGCTKPGIRLRLCGIGSSIAAPCYAASVTHRAVATAFIVITGHGDEARAETQVDWKNVAEFFGTRVILMGVERSESLPVS